MLCPNCKKELMNINGRYICVECGTEVSENEMNLDKNDLTKENSPVMEAVETVPLTEENFTLPVTTAIESSVSNHAVEEAAIAPELSEVSPVIAPVETIPEGANPMAEMNVSSTPLEPSEVGTEPSIAEMTGANVNIQAQPEVTIAEFPQPVVDVPPVATSEQDFTVTVPEQVENTFNEQTSPAFPVEVEQIPPVEVNPTEMTSAEIQSSVEPPLEEPVQNLAPIETVASEIEATPIEINTETAAITPQMPVEEVPILEQVEVPVATAEVDFSKDAPVDPFEIAETPAIPSNNQDKTIYQNPMFDEQQTNTQGQYSNQEPNTPISQETVPAESVSYPASNKKLIYLIAAGVVVFLLLFVGGILAYRSLSKPAVIEETTITTDNITSDDDIDSEIVIDDI